MQQSQLHRIQKTTENIHVSDGLRMTFLIIAPYIYKTQSSFIISLLNHQ